MANWYVKDLSRLTGVSVQTLHHYDRIDLLKPSMRLDNGYRVYSEEDLLHLQQIIALKFFGFNLEKIKTLLCGEEDALAQFATQAKLLEEKASNYLNASNTLKSIVADLNQAQTIPWEKILSTIEVFTMAQNLDHAWVKDIFTPAELKEYATFEKEAMHNATPKQKADFEKAWDKIVMTVEENLDRDPESNIGIRIGGDLMTLINGLYGKKYAHLRTKIFERGFGEGKGLDEVGLTPQTVAWLDKAVDAYWSDRVYRVLENVGTMPNQKLHQSWEGLMEEIYGHDDARKSEIIEFVLKDPRISDDAKAWIKQIYNV